MDGAQADVDSDDDIFFLPVSPDGHFNAANADAADAANADAANATVMPGALSQFTIHTNPLAEEYEQL
jgi:hypothetical protein